LATKKQIEDDLAQRLKSDVRPVFSTGSRADRELTYRDEGDHVAFTDECNIEALAPGGGFVFATVHNIRANDPPENIVAMWEALQEYGSY
jgi:hypothetical protein